MKDSEKQVLDAIVQVLKEAPNRCLGMTETIQTVREVIGDIPKVSGNVGKVHKTTIMKGIWMLNSIRNSTWTGKDGKKMKTRQVIKCYEIKRKRYLKMVLKE